MRGFFVSTKQGQINCVCKTVSTNTYKSSLTCPTKVTHNVRGFAMARQTRVRLPEQKPIEKRKIQTITTAQVSSVKQRTEA